MAFIPLSNWGFPIRTGTPTTKRSELETLVMVGSGSVARSQNYDGTEGWALFGDGTIFFRGGEIGDLTVTDVLTLGTNGVIRTAASGQRIELTNTDRNSIAFYTGDSEEKVHGKLEQLTSGSGPTRTLQFGVKAPYINTNDQGIAIVVRSASEDATTFPPGVIIATTPNDDPGNGSGLLPEFRIQNAIPFITDGDVTIGGAVTIDGNLLAVANWTPSYTNLTVGNGTVIARYQRVGDIVTAHFRFTLGSTSAVGTSPRVSMPVTSAGGAAGYDSRFALGIAMLDDSGGSGFVGRVMYATSTTFAIVVEDTSGTHGKIATVTATVPMTWTTGDTISFIARYEAS